MGDNVKNNDKDDIVSLSDSDSSYVIEEEIVEYEITESEEQLSGKNKNGSKSNLINQTETSNKNLQSNNKVVNIDNDKDNSSESSNNNINSGKEIKSKNEQSKEEENISNSFKNVSDSMENIKIKLSSNNLDKLDSYGKLNFNKTENEFIKDIQRMRYVVNRINETHNSLKKALHDMKGNPFSIPDDEPYYELASECSTEDVADVNVDYCEDDMFNIDEADVFERYIEFIDEENKDKFTEHYEKLYNVNELFKKTIFSSAIPESSDC
ncbi:hypothetical protein BCR32DRAFT_265722 [Anaeromyces robustus]|uniref:Uncharacterized protein n=1 Tax=Anaeromyces robustus TaxID=1754192 RepID=A0A1Y1XHV8_9FUNG|nr:hypothetical protein BCR32DRAFT_265722 [Anaeromyces robustus]|eukprot:ORX85323.1 hypothetical protein BCR32DRAFT_265722 [Anaeromyces robustus]